VARSCRRIASFVGVSTAYVTPQPKQGDGCPLRVEEELAPLPADAAKLLRAIETGEASERRLLRETRHPNTYTLTKCLAEHLAAQQADELPITLVRPSIVSASRAHPFEGWIDSAAAFAGFVVLLATGRLRVVAADPDALLDVVPCDEVARRVVDAAFAPPSDGAPRILHAVAGLEGSVPLRLCREVIERSFASSGALRLAWMGRRGPRFRVEHALRHELPAHLAAAWLSLRGQVRSSRSVRRLLQAQRDLHRQFAYFTHASFDFRSSAPLAPRLEPRAYLELVCAGVARHLLRGGTRGG
jgi:nucleoside-diphosphate-sugar epimerase